VRVLDGVLAGAVTLTLALTGVVATPARQSARPVAFDAVPASTGATTIAVWSGDRQTFGSPGRAQRWVNILGNVSDADGIASLSFRLNSGTSRPLSIGPDTRRLQDAGDFNVEIGFHELVPGDNTVAIRAQDTTGAVTTRTVVAHNVAGQTWPKTYSVDWGSVANVQTAAQIVDGRWTRSNRGARTAQVGYDRLLGIGDFVAWDDYEVVVPITVHRVDTRGYAAPAYGPGVGLLFRWTGHYDTADNSQPRWGYQPLGSLGWYRWRTDGTQQLQLTDEQGKVRASTTALQLATGTKYIFKMRVETKSNGPFYRLKAWKAGTKQPGWMLKRQESFTDPQVGSFLLVAHYVDATFGDVKVRPL